ncbi:alkyl sulfatase dimerization domain-containing protein [Vibrio chaetopteri]
MNINSKSLTKYFIVGVSLIAPIGVVHAANFTQPQAVYSGAEITLSQYPNGAIVNASLLDSVAKTQPSEAYIKEVTPGVWAIVGYHFGYKAVIEGPNELILFDTGDDVEEALEVIELVRNNISDKPIKTVIYSHSHYAFGTEVIKAKYGDDLKVIGHPDLNKNITQSSGLGAAIPELAPSLYARTLEQFSALLPELGPDGQAPSPLGRTKGFVPVNTPVEHGQTMVIDDIEMVFFTDFDSDSNDQVIVYLPESQTVLNNHLWPTFPNFYTLRGSVYRDPTEWAAGIQFIRSLEPEHLINTHTTHISGKEEIQTALNGYYDAIMYLYDQTLRGILLGKTPEELRYWVQLPKDLAELPHNQMSYGEFSYYPKYIYQYAMGWFGRDAENLNRVAPDVQAGKIVEGFGGVDAVKLELREVLANQEFAWAAELGGYLVKVVPNDTEANQLLADALRQMGYRTEATIPRSWYLTRALQLEDKLQIPQIAFTGVESVIDSPADTYVNQYRVRLDPRVSYGEDQMIAITFNDSDAPTMGLHVRSGVAEFVSDINQYARAPDTNLALTKRAWGEYFMGEISLGELLKHKDVKTDDNNRVNNFFLLFDQVAPSKTQLIPASEVN